MKQKTIKGKLRRVDELEIQREFKQPSVFVQAIKGSVGYILNESQNGSSMSVTSFWGIIESCPENDASMLIILSKYLSEKIIAAIFNNNKETDFYKKLKLVFLEMIKKGELAMNFFHSREIFPTFLLTNFTSKDKKDIIQEVINYESDFPIASFLIGQKNNFNLLINSNIEENYIVEILEKTFATSNNVAHDITEYTEKFKQILDCKLSNDAKFKIIFDAQLKDQETSYHLFYNEAVFSLFIESDLSSDLKQEIFFRAFDREKETAYMLFKNSRLFIKFLNFDLSDQSIRIIMFKAFEVDKTLATELLTKSNRNARKLEKILNLDITGKIDGGIRIFEGDIDPRLPLTKPHDTFDLFMNSNFDNKYKLDIILKGLFINNNFALEYSKSSEVFNIFIKSSLYSEYKKIVILKLFEAEYLGISFKDLFLKTEYFKEFISCDMTWEDKKEIILTAFQEKKYLKSEFILFEYSFTTFLDSGFSEQDKLEILRSVLSSKGWSIGANPSILNILQYPDKFKKLMSFEEISVDNKYSLIIYMLGEIQDFIGHFLNKDIFEIIQKIGFSNEQFKGIFHKILQIGSGYLLLEFLEYFPFTKEQIKYFKSLKDNKRAKSIFGRMHKVDISNFPIVFDYMIEHKRKALINFFDKLISIREIGLETEFVSIDRLLNLQQFLESENSVSKQKTILKTNYFKILELTNSNNKEKKILEFERFLSSSRDFKGTNFTKLQKIFGELIITYFNKSYDRKLLIKIKSEIRRLFELNKIDYDIDSINKDKILNPMFIEVFKIYTKSTWNKNELIRLMISYLKGETNIGMEADKNFPYILDSNKIWLKDNLPGNSGKIWLSRNEKIFKVSAATEKEKQDKLSKQIEHHFTDIRHIVHGLFPLNFINELFKEYPEIFNDIGDFIDYFYNKFKPRLEDLYLFSKSVDRKAFDNAIKDIEFQIKSIHELNKTKKAKKITSIKIYKELDSMRVMMMGNWVDNSCLSYYSEVGNCWSTITNAIEINKGVFFIEDQDGNIIGRVLTAIDNEKRLLRFNMYYRGNVGIDLDIYFDKYIKTLVRQMKLLLGGNTHGIKQLICEKWYIDPVYGNKEKIEILS